MRRGSSRKEKKKKCSTDPVITLSAGGPDEKIPTVNFTQSDPTPTPLTKDRRRYPDQEDASSTTAVNVVPRKYKNISSLKLQEKSILLAATTTTSGEEEELLDYSPKEGETPPDSVRLTFRMWGDGEMCENKRPFHEVKFCFVCDEESDKLRHSTRMCSEKLNKHGKFYPIYRHIFMCPACFEENPREKKVFITEKAMKMYYSSSSSPSSDVGVK